MTHSFERLRRVEFAETDMAGIMHFSNFFRFMEETEHAFFRSLGLELHGESEGRMQGWVRVHAECDYVTPARYGELLDVRLDVRSMGKSSIVYGFLFRKNTESALRAEEATGAPDPVVIARGEMCVVAVHEDPESGGMRSRPIPLDVARLLEVSPAPIPQRKD